MMRFPALAHIRRKIFLGSISVCIFSLIVIIVGYASYENRLSAWQAGEQNVRNIARLAEQTIAREIELYDLSLQGILEDVRSAKVMALEPAIRAKVLFDRPASASGRGYIVVTDATGAIVLDSKGVEPRKGTLVDRDYFQYHAMHDDPSLHISRPFVARYSENVLNIALSRRISAPDGSFSGIVSGNMKTSFIEGILRKVSLGSAGGLTLRHEDGAVIARSVLLSVSASMNWETSYPARSPGAAEGVFSGRTNEGTERLFAFRRVAGTPLLIIAGVSVEDVLGSWLLRTVTLGGMIFVMAVSIVFLVVTLLRELSRRTTAERVARSLANTDGLTGVANRRAFDDALPRALSDAARSGRDLSLLMLDVDWFKSYNDVHGHMRGDVALKRIATALKGAIRESDVVARYGGEEFAIILAPSDHRHAADVARRILDAVEALALHHAAGDHARMTVSCGFASCLRGDDSIAPEALIAAADRALYRAKAAGRNRVIADGEGDRSCGALAA